MKKIMLLIVGSMLLVSCGGGGGGNSPANPSGIDIVVANLSTQSDADLYRCSCIVGL